MPNVRLPRGEATYDDRSAITLTFLAPAERCNQHCPNCYITEVAKEPVQTFDRTPEDYARFVQDFLDVAIPVLSVKFQGYEVTLPRSWAYLEAVFRLAQLHDIRRGFITNGMLLHRWTDRIQALDPARITVSLDGASAAINDRFRGLAGAFEATTTSVRRFLEAAPEFSERLAVASVLRDEDGFRSLLEMPEVLSRLRISRWLVSLELELVSGVVRPRGTLTNVTERFEALQNAAEREGIRFHASDEAGSLPPETAERVQVHRPPTPDLFYRLHPTGGVQIGDEIFQPWSEDQVIQWNPARDNAVDAVGYWKAATAF